MNKNDLLKKLKKAKLILGNIEETSKTFFSRYKPAPIGAVIHDFDYFIQQIIPFNKKWVRNIIVTLIK